MTAPNLWEDSDLIFAYTRAQALEDGVLVDITPWATEAGFKIPVAVTAAVLGHPAALARTNALRTVRDRPGLGSPHDSA